MPYEIKMLDPIDGELSRRTPGHRAASSWAATIRYSRTPAPGPAKRKEGAAIKRALDSGTFVLRLHDYPARVSHGWILSRLSGDSGPGPETSVEHRAVSETGVVSPS
jgi:hypothetical protein